MAAPPAQRTVLLVEDDAEVREVMAECLVLRGFEVLEAASGLEALLQVKRARPDAVVLDLNMPRLGGLEALRRILVFDPLTAVVAVAEQADSEVHWQALALGARDVLPKPVVLEDLLGTLEGAERSPGAAAAQGLPAEPTARSPATAPRPRILVADEDPDVRTTLEEFLTVNGYQAISAADDGTALDAIAQAPPDIVLLDISIAGLNGIEALATIRALAPQAMVIIVSAISDVEIVKRVLARGAFDYITKPVDLAYLGESVETALAMKRLAM